MIETPIRKPLFLPKITLYYDKTKNTVLKKRISSWVWRVIGSKFREKRERKEGAIK